MEVAGATSLSLVTAPDYEKLGENYLLLETGGVFQASLSQAFLTLE
jgi:hypothetical protein